MTHFEDAKDQEIVGVYIKEEPQDDISVDGGDAGCYAEGIKVEVEEDIPVEVDQMEGARMSDSHIKEEPSDNVEKPEQFRDEVVPHNSCHHCGRKFRYSRTLNKHIPKCFATADAGFCTNEGMESLGPDEANISLEESTEHDEYNPYNNHTCSLCKYKVRNASCLKHHMMIKHPNHKPHKCSFCDFRSKTTSWLKKHVERTHPTNKPTQFKVHTMRMRSDKIFQYCKLCQYRTKNLMHFKRHKLQHSIDKNHQCTLCYIRTKTARLLKEHMMKVHNAKKPQTCRLCDYSAKTYKKLMCHMSSRKHKGGKPHTCNFGDLVQNQELKNHITGVHMLR